MCDKFFTYLSYFFMGSKVIRTYIPRIFDNERINKLLATRKQMEIHDIKVSPYLSIRELEEKRDYYKERSNISLYRYLIKLGRNKRSAFGKHIKNFIECTKLCGETDPVVIMTNIRQFMNDMKNYLIANGGAKFEKEVAKAKAKAPKNFNLDEILDNVVCELVLIPLKEHLDDVIFKEYSSSVTGVMEHMYYIKERPLSEMGIRADIQPFSEDEIIVLTKNFYMMQISELPSEKLKYFLAAISNIYAFTKSLTTGKKIEICADDFIPLLVWVLAQCRTFTVEVEGLYMWFLMNPSLQNGECGYYITTLLCAGALLNEPNKLFDVLDDSTDQCPCVSTNVLQYYYYFYYYSDRDYYRHYCGF